MHKKLLTTLFMILALGMMAQTSDPRFRQISYKDGLSDNKVNCIYKSTSGFVWIGTMLGLNRYDGYRIRRFYAQCNQPHTLIDNTIEDLQEAADGHLWVRTPSGHCLLDPKTQRFDRDTRQWLRRHGMRGDVARVSADSRHNLWIATADRAIYHYDFATRRATLAAAPAQMPRRGIADLIAVGRSAVVTLDDGTLVDVSLAPRRRIVIDQSISRQNGTTARGFKTFVDRRHNRWVFADDRTWLYNNKVKRWTLTDLHNVSDMAEDGTGHLLVTTDHRGLLRMDHDGRVERQSLNRPTDPHSLPDNTLQCITIDNLGVVWIGTYRMGLAYYYEGLYHIGTLPLGDVCSMTEVQGGSLWFGTNSSGLGRYDLATGATRYYTQAESRLGSDIVVSTLAARDGSLWFGTFQGGMARLRDGRFTVYRRQPGALASDNVWSLIQLPDGRIAIGTLGAGVQILDPATGRFQTYDSRNSHLASDYVASLALDGNSQLMIGHSQGVSRLDLGTRRVTNYTSPNTTSPQSSPSVNQIIIDSRRLLWIATVSGLEVYDHAADRMYTVNLQGTHLSTEVSSIAEDRRGVLWVTTNDGLKSISVIRDGGAWQFMVNIYGESDGVQNRLFNKRSALALTDGRVLMGGIDGVNVIPALQQRQDIRPMRVLFSGLTLYDRPIEVGEEFNGHTILPRDLNEGHEVTLRHNENTFSIQLSTDAIGLPERPRFLYRLRGMSDKWMMTSQSQLAIQYAALAPGHYTLEVDIADHAGRPLGRVSRLSIVIEPPFYFSLWAWLLYAVLAALAGWYAYRNMVRKQREREERMELRKQKEVEETKLVFFTNISHELRTPLTLIMAPLSGIIEEETNERIAGKLRLIQRNAHRLLDMVNQMLDLRRLMMNKEELHTDMGNVVSYVKAICDQFAGLSEKPVTLTFYACAENVIIDFDRDKMGKIVTNLLSNAYKFAPRDGRVDVSVTVKEPHTLELKVSDNGPGISDADKQHIFERFYQADSGHQGSGIGLHIVWEYTRMHGGTVTVADNPGGGTVFIVAIPMTKSEIEGKTFVTAHAETTPSPPPPATPATTPEVPRPRMLLVDDNEPFLEFMTAELGHDYDIAVAHDGEEALSRVTADLLPDLIVTDVMMPRMDGNELCRRLKHDPRTMHIPVMILTSRQTEDREIESRECGADDYLTKPFSMELLMLHLDQLLRHRQAQPRGGVEPRIARMEITSQDQKFVDQATRYIEQHLSDPDLSVEQMSADMGMSRTKLYRRFVSVTGKTPSDFIRRVRLLHAEQLLIKSQMTISEITYQVGFTSQNYFSKCFKDHFGYLPSQYVKEKK